MDGCATFDTAEAHISRVLRKDATHALEERDVQQQCVNGFLPHD